MKPTRPSDHDRERVRSLLGREPRGNYAIVVRDRSGDPVVLQNAPLLDDGTPMPTRFWLVGPDEQRRIGQLESRGGVNAAEAAIDPDVLADAHRRYGEERDRDLPAGYTGPVPSGGVGGTRVGVKCLHAHWAWYLAGGDDPVGAWIAAELGDDSRGQKYPVDSDVDSVVDSVVERDDECGLDRFSIGSDTTDVSLKLDQTTTTAVIPWGAANLTERWLNTTDPPAPADLTNALGTIDDELDELVRTTPGWAPSADTVFDGPGITALAALELGSDELPDTLTMARTTVEELFRLTATASRRERADNPGLPDSYVNDIIAVCCIVLAVMRRFGLASAEFVTTHAGSSSSEQLQ